MKKITALFLLGVIIILGVYGLSYGVSSYATSFKSTYPSSPLSSLSTVSGQAGNLCTVCHGVSGGARNAYGLAFAGASHNFISIQAADSDGDTFSNIVEINAGTFPGNSASFPATADVTAPTVSLTAPANGATYTTAQTVAINATAADAVGVTRVEFYDGATLLGTDTTSPYSFAWAIGSGNNGSHSLTARAYDAANNVRTSTPAVGVIINIAVTPPNGAALYSTNCAGCHNPLATSSKLGRSASQIQTAINNNAGGMGFLSTLTPAEIQAIATALAPAADVTAPTVSLTAPANGATYTTAQTVAINATAADAVGVTRVEFYDGATLLGTDTTSPYSFAWAIGSGNNGAHSLTARAYDAANNVRTSTPAIGVTINIVTADVTAPTVSLTAPANGAIYTTAQTVAINATAADAVGVARVEFYDGATLLGTDTTSPYSFAWAIGSGNNGAHSLTARAYDAANNVRTSTPAIGVTVNISGASMNGAALYSTNCQGCHNAIASSEVLGKSTSDIQEAISENKGGMGFLSTLTVPEIQAIAGALAQSGGTPPSAGSDKKAPKIMSFMMSKKATSLEVPITAFVATDDVGVTDYMVSESSGSPSGNWSSTPQSSYTFSSAGKKVLYAYVRDAAGNISKARKAKVKITLSLTGQSSIEQILIQQVSAYDPAVSPLVSTDLTVAEPVAVGSVAEGGDMLTLQVVLEDIAFPVDAYLTLYSPSAEGREPVHAYTLNAQDQFEPLVGAKQVWMTGVTSIQEVVSETPVNELIPGKYLIVFEIRLQGSTEVYYSWMTSFTIQ